VRYDVTHGSETFGVEIREISPDLYEVRVDGSEPVRVDACKTARTVYSLLIGARQYEGSVDALEQGLVDVHVGSSAFELRVVDERRRALAESVMPRAVGKQELRAEMPGKIVKVLVALGESVAAEQGVVVIEAMKMENELRSPIAGRVTELHVSEGDAVESGALLAVIEPPG
jgi:biotin carboxyl carrier protein